MTLNVGARGTAKGRLLAINDFHGAPRTTDRVGRAGERRPGRRRRYLATWLERLRAEARVGDEDVLTVGAGDMVGASPLLSAAFHDEPTVELLSELGLDMTAVGDHPRRGRRGAPADCSVAVVIRWTAVRTATASPARPTAISPPTSCIDATGLPILLGIEGPVHPEASRSASSAFPCRTQRRIVNPAGISNVTFLGEVDTANFYAAALRFIGIRSLVLLIHDGGLQNPPPPVPDPSGCANFIGRSPALVAGLRPDRHRRQRPHAPVVHLFRCRTPQARTPCRAGANGTLVTSIGFTLDRRTRTFTSMSAENVIVENGVRLPDGTWARDAAGNFLRNPGLVDPEAKVLLRQAYRVAIAPLANRIVGQITADIVNFGGFSGESPMGDVVADAQLDVHT